MNLRSVHVFAVVMKKTSYLIRPPPSSPPLPPPSRNITTCNFHKNSLHRSYTYSTRQTFRNDFVIYQLQHFQNLFRFCRDFSCCTFLTCTLNSYSYVSPKKNPNGNPIIPNITFEYDEEFSSIQIARQIKRIRIH